MQWLLVALGGAFGSVLRFLLQGRIQATHAGLFPWGTLAVNLLGSGLIGLLAALFEFAPAPPQNLRALLMIGVLGGFTTFSSFSLENLNLLRNGEWRTALAYVIASNGFGVGLAVAAYFAARTLARAFSGGAA